MTRTRVALCLTVGLAACGGVARLAVRDGTGPSPILPEPRTSLIPTIHVVTARGWADDAAPIAAPGLEVQALARGLDHPRWLHVLPNGDVLVAETNAPERPEATRGLRGWLVKRFQKKAGGAVPSADRITLLRDADGDGRAEVRTTFLDSLRSPFGMALVGDTLYIANTDALVRVPYIEGATTIHASPVEVLRLPAGPRNLHWTKSLIASPDGRHLYVGVGANSNVAEHGMDEEVGRAAIWEIDRVSGSHRVYASGLRNPVGMAWVGDTLWTAVNERDELGPDLVPDYLTSVREGAFYGWPWSYFGAHIDDRVEPRRPDLVATAVVPDYALGPHTASLGLAAASGSALGTPFDSGMFVGQHGSWNRRPFSGYKVLFVPFRDGRPAGDPIDVLTGFVTADGDAWGRPVGVAMDGRGHLLVADDVGNVVWRVSPSRSTGPVPRRRGAA